MKLKPTGLLILGAVLAAGLSLVMFTGAAPPTEKAASSEGFDNDIKANADRLLAEGKQIFRFDTFGSEAFWGDGAKLHQAIAGAKNGGVGLG